jgi:MFS family permease
VSDSWFDRHTPALKFRNFRLLWLGLLASFTGSFMQQAALLWHVSILAPPDKKAIALGTVGLVRVVPIIVLSLVSGVVADALDRRKLMLATSIGGGVVAIALAVLSFARVELLWPIYVLAALGAAASAFDGPARHALLPMLVPRETLPNAVSLNTAMIQAAAVGGPALSGLLIATADLSWAYVANAVSFACIAVALRMMRDVPATERQGDRKDDLSLAAAREGLRFVFRSPMIRSSMLLDFFATFFSSATALLPIFAQDVLHVGAGGYGWLFAAPAVGAVTGSIAMIRLTNVIERRGPVLVWAVVAYGLATVVFGFSRSFWLTFGCLAASGLADSVSMVIRNLIRQLETPDALRGRMTGINMVFFMGGPQLGELEAGLVANWRGAPFSVVTGGIGCLIATGLVIWTTPSLWRYRKV